MEIALEHAIPTYSGGLLWNPPHWLGLLLNGTTLTLSGRIVHIQVWQYLIAGITGHLIPVYLLDTALPDNDAADQSLSDYIYGWRCLLSPPLRSRARPRNPQSFGAMNEGHSAPLALDLLQERWSLMEHHRILSLSLHLSVDLISILHLGNYDLDLAKLLTSCMKAAVNDVPGLSS